MGVPALFAGISNLLASENGPVTDRTERVRPVEHQARSANDAQSAQPDAQPAAHGDAAGTGVYQVSDGVVFQLQLERIAFGGDAGQTDAASANTAQPNPAPQPTAAETTDAPSNIIPQQAAPARQNATRANTSTVPHTAATATAGITSAGGSSAQSQEVQLRAALQALGLSPAAIQDFMAVAQLLAQIAPSVFQNFVTQMVYLAKSMMAQGGTGAATPAPGNQTPATRTSVPTSQESNATPAPKLEIASIQVTEAEVQVDVNQAGQTGQNANGSPSGITLEAQAINIQAVELLLGSPQPNTATASQATPANNNTPAQALAASA